MHLKYNENRISGLTLTRISCPKLPAAYADVITTWLVYMS